MQREEEMMEAGLAEMNRDKTHDLVQTKDREVKGEEWDWESVIEEDGSTREAFELRGSSRLECHNDGEENTGKGSRDETEKGGKERHEESGKERRNEGGKERHEEESKEKREEGGKEGQDEEGGNEGIRRQDDGQDEVGNRGFRWQDDDDEDDKKQVEEQGNVVRRQLEDDRWQDEDGKGWATDVWKKDDERSRELGKDGQRVNLEDFFWRYKRDQGEQQQQQGGRDWSEWESFSCRGSRHFESRGKDGGCEQEDGKRKIERGNWPWQGNEKRTGER